jgi:hypothetical protein
MQGSAELTEFYTALTVKMSMPQLLLLLSLNLLVLLVLLPVLLLTADNAAAVALMQVEAVMDRIKDNVSLDHMARLLVDVQQDSSSIVDSIISQHQRELLNLIFLGDAPNRNKVKFTVALLCINLNIAVQRSHIDTG